MLLSKAKLYRTSLFQYYPGNIKISVNCYLKKSSDNIQTDKKTTRFTKHNMRNLKNGY